MVWERERASLRTCEPVRPVAPRMRTRIFARSGFMGEGFVYREGLWWAVGESLVVCREELWCGGECENVWPDTSPTCRI